MILITGCSGYIGSQIAYTLSTYKKKFIGIDNLKYSYKRNFIYKKNFYKLNISDKKILEIIKNFNIKTVIHCAAYAYVNEGEIYKKRYILNNVKNTKKFINFCEDNKIDNFIFLSSSNVYKDNKNILQKNKKIDPKNVYGKNKMQIENFLIKKKFKSKIILRLFNVIGLQRKFHIYKPKIKYQRIFFKILNKKFRPRLNYYLHNNLRKYPTRDFIDINDVTNLVIKVIKKLQSNKVNGIFNVGSGNSKSVIDLYNKFKKLKKGISKPIFTSLKKEELIGTRANINKTKKYFNWNPNITLNHSVKSLIKLCKA